MTGQKRSRSLPEAGSRNARADHDEWLERVGELASQDAGGVPTDLLGEYLPMLAEAATLGRFPGRAQIDAVRQQGRRAAEQGVVRDAGCPLDAKMSSQRPRMVIAENQLRYLFEK